MTTTKKLAAPALVLAASLLLAACGGGGGTTISPPKPTPTPTPPPAACSFTFSGDSTIELGKTASATVQPTCSGAIKDVVWSQTAGPAMTLLDTRSPTIAFEPTGTGVVTLKAVLT